MQKRELPHNAALEESLVGAVLIDPAAFRRVDGVVGTDSFYVRLNGHAWTAIAAILGRGAPLDPLTLAAEMEGPTNMVQGDLLEYAMRAEVAVPSSLNVEDYARRVADLAARRDGIAKATALAQAAWDADDYGAKRDELATSMLRGSETGARAVSAREASSALYDDIDRWVNDPLGPGQVRGTSSGLQAVDALTGGFESSLTLVAAVTSTGKTAFTLQVAHNVAAEGGRVLYVTPEMLPRQIMQRLVCAKASVSADDLEKGRIAAGELARVHRAQGALADLPLFITQARRMDEIRAVVYRYLPLDMVVIDGAEWVEGGTKDKTHEARGEVARWALGLAVNEDVQCPVLLTTQIALKAVAERADKRPQPGDIYQTSEMDMATDLTLMLHSEDRWSMNAQKDPTYVTEVWLWKHRLKRRRIPMMRRVHHSQFGFVADLARPDQQAQVPPPVHFGEDAPWYTE